MVRRARDRAHDDTATAAPVSKSRRAALYAQIQERILQDAVAVPLVDTITHNAKRAEDKGDYLDALANYMWIYNVRLKKA
jgi:hypothetical protein